MVKYMEVSHSHNVAKLCSTLMLNKVLVELKVHNNAFPKVTFPPLLHIL